MEEQVKQRIVVLEDGIAVVRVRTAWRARIVTGRCMVGGSYGVYFQRVSSIAGLYVVYSNLVTPQRTNNRGFQLDTEGCKYVPSSPQPRPPNAVSHSNLLSYLS